MATTGYDANKTLVGITLDYMYRSTKWYEKMSGELRCHAL